MTSTTIPRRRFLQTVAAGAVGGLAGCGGGGSGGGGSDGASGGGSGVNEGGDFACTDVGDAGTTRYDAAETGFLASFAYPDVFDGPANQGQGPATRADFQRGFGGEASSERDSVVLNATQLTDTGVEEQNVPDRLEQIEYGDGVAYAGPTMPPSMDDDSPSEALFQAHVPYQMADVGQRFFGITFNLGVALQTREGNATPSEACATAIDETAREVARSVAPNPDTQFGSVHDSG